MSCNGCPPIICARSIPESLMSTFKGLGINTLYLSETENGKYTQAQWRAAAATAGLKYIDYPSSSITADEADPNLLGYVLKPEYPDRLGINISVWQAAYNAIRITGSGVKPILGMFSGSTVTQNLNGTPPYNGSQELPFLPLCDWVAEDWMPINSDPTRYTPAIIGNALVNLGAWSGGKPGFAQIETCYSNFSANGRAPTTDEMKTEVRTAMANPATSGIIFNTQVQAGGAISFTYDGTDSPMKTAITQIIEEISPNSITAVPYITLYNDGTWKLN